MVRCTKFNTSTQNSKTSQIVTINKKEMVSSTISFVKLNPNFPCFDFIHLSDFF